MDCREARQAAGGLLLWTGEVGDDCWDHGDLGDTGQRETEPGNNLQVRAPGLGH